MRRWWVLAVLLLAFAALQVKLWWGEGGMYQARALQHQVGEQRAENASLQRRNDALSAEVEDLKSGEAAVEDRARSELGMIKPGETFYRVVEPGAQGASPAPQGASTPDPEAGIDPTEAEPEP